MTGGLEDLFRCARAHGELTSSASWADDLESMLRVAWDIMDPTQRLAFANHADVIAVAEAGGSTWSPDGEGMVS